MQDEFVKMQLEEQLERLKERIEVFNMIEARLIKMKELTQTVVDKDLSQEEVEAIRREVKSLEEQAKQLTLETIDQADDMFDLWSGKSIVN